MTKVTGGTLPMEGTLGKPTVNAPPRPAQTRTKTIAALLFMVIAGGAFGSLIGTLLAKLQKGSPVPAEQRIWFLIAVPLVIFGVIAWHELGHLIGGWLSGFQFMFYAVGPLRIDRHGDGVKVSFNKTLALWGGIAASMPRRKVSIDEMRQGMLRMVAGGPGASIVGGVVGLGAGLLIRVEQPLASMLLMTFGAISSVTALATAIPNAVGGFVSDGARILQLLRGGAKADRWAAVGALSAMSTSGIRPREWPSELVEQATSLKDGAYDDVSAAWTRFNFHSDKNENDLAEEWLDYTLAIADAWPASARQLIHADAAFFYAQVKRDSSKGREFLDLATKRSGFLKKHQLALMEAAVLESEGQVEQALAAVERGFQALPATEDPTSTPFREKLEQVRTRALAR
jgi:hypothetical protein